jgi:hypothetical protein
VALKTLRTILPLVALLAASCAKDSGSSGNQQAAEGARVKNFDSWASGMGGGYKQDEKGNWVPQDGSKRSSFDRANRDSPYFKGAFSGKDREYKAGEFSKNTWQGNKEYARKAYDGNTDGSRFQTASNYGNKTARDAGKVARDSTRTAREGGSYDTSTARESGGARHDHPSDAETDARRRVFISPIQSTIDWQAQREMSIKETKSLLGKD